MYVAWIYASIITMASVLLETEAAHFRGGTIHWRSLGGRKVKFDFIIGYVYGRGPGCTEKKNGELVSDRTSANVYFWKCSSGCPRNINLSNTIYICIDANKKENWEHGGNSFIYDFPNDGPFIVSFTNRDWIKLSMPGKGLGPWYVPTRVVLGKRSDTGGVNASPISLSKTIYYYQLDKFVQLPIPVIDPDGDNLRCRWSVGKECNTVCRALPGAQLDEETCTIRFHTDTSTGYINNGIYAVALTIEDYPKVPMTMGATRKTPLDALSSIPLQFIVEIRSAYYETPQFVAPSPSPNEIITTGEGSTLAVDLYADNGKNTTVNVSRIVTMGVVGMKASPITQDTNRINTFMTTLTWNTTTKDIGDHLVCASVTNAEGVSGDQLCIILKIVPKECMPNPCKNGAECKSSRGTYHCTCLPGSKGNNCEIGQNDCKSNPCNNGGVCTDIKVGFSCKCPDGWTGKTCHLLDQGLNTSEPSKTTSTSSSQTTSEMPFSGHDPSNAIQCVFSYTVWHLMIGLFCFILGLVLGFLSHCLLNHCVARHEKEPRREPFFKPRTVRPAFVTPVNFPKPHRRH